MWETVRGRWSYIAPDVGPIWVFDTPDNFHNGKSDGLLDGSGACNASRPDCALPALFIAMPGKIYRLRIGSLTSLSSLNFEIEGHFQLVMERKFDMAQQAWTGLIFPNPETSFSSKLADPNNTNNLILIYSGRSDPAAKFNAADGWNREHLSCPTPNTHLVHDLKAASDPTLKN